MTTDAGSVWDRGPGAEADPPDSLPRREADRGDQPAANERDGRPAPDDQPEADDGNGEQVASAGTVWSRGPSIEALTQGPPPKPSPLLRPEPVLPPPRPPVRATRTRPQVRRPASVLAGVTVVALMGALAWSLGIVGGEDGDAADASATTVVPAPIAPLPSVAIPTTAPPTVPATTAAPPTSAPTTTTSPTTSSTTTSTTTTSTTSTSTTSTTTSTTVAAPAAEPAGPRVVIAGSVGPCRFGSDCLVAGFTISDFPAAQREFVCEFADGSRHTFRFDGTSVEQACATSSATGSITIEVGGVRSETVTR